MAYLSNISITPITADTVVTLQEAKDYLEVDFDDRDNEILRNINTATMALQNYTGMVFLPSKVSLFADLVKGTDSFILPFSNGASDDNIKGNRYFGGGQIEYNCGATEDWMKTAVLLYVADLFDNKGDSRDKKVGGEAKSYCTQFISHGGFF